MREAYAALCANGDRWKRTVMIVTYDEHGGFYDHVEPIPIKTKPPKGANWTGGEFTSTGVRVPAVIASPLVQGRSVYTGALDHTSILQFIASVLGKDGEAYSDQVEDRRKQGIGNVADALNSDKPRAKIATPPQTAPLPQPGAARATGAVVPIGMTVKKGENAKSFEMAARQLAAAKPDGVQKQYKEVVHWMRTK
jgi:phospholipase C